ncbi:MAG TPA: glycosyltransferase [Sulfurovum sp.]|nr:glycosyltransferase [Sulfurovum sp.]
MKVMHFISSRGMGRGEVYVDLVNTLSKSIETVLLVPKGALYKDRVEDNVEVIEYYAYNRRNNPLLFLELWWKIKSIKPDIVHTHFGKASQIFNVLNKVLKLPHVATKHNPRKGKIFNVLPHVIAVSNGVKESIKNDNVNIIYNGVQPIEVGEKRKNNIFTLVAIGRLDKIKGFDILIRECAKLDFPYHLQIVGEGEERKSLENLIHLLRLEEKITLLGFRKDIPQLMKDADIVVMSSHSEGFSLVMVEALFYANIFISTKVSGAVEILNEKFLIEGFHISEKVREIHQNYDRRVKYFRELGEINRNKFLLTHIAKEHIAYYQNILFQLEGERQCEN